LPWLKTEHAFPSPAALPARRRKLGEILVSAGMLTPAALASALATQQSGMRIGEHLVARGLIGEDALYQALSLQQSIPAGAISPDEVPRRVARSIPRIVARQWLVLPVRIADGRMTLASPEIPRADMPTALRGYTSLEIRFHLVTPANFESLRDRLL
jgi:bacteriophage N4 adsorption protein B